MAASQSPRHCFCQRRRSYKQMVQDIAEDLGAEDVQKIVFHHDLPAEYNGKPALTALRRMEMQGKFSDSDIEFLESLLQSIYRCDLINKHVMQYRRNYCGCESGAQGSSAPIPSTQSPCKSTSPHIMSSPRPLPHAMPTPHNMEHPLEMSVRLQPEDKMELRDLLNQYVPREVIRKSTITEKLFGRPFLRSLMRKPPQAGERRSLSSSVVRDGPTTSKMCYPNITSSQSLSACQLDGRKVSETDCLSSRCASSTSLPLQPRRATCPPLPGSFAVDSDEVEWVVLEGSTADSGTCSASSFDSSLDIEICRDDLPQAHEKPESKAKPHGKQRSLVTWRVTRSEFMIPLFKHKRKTFEKKIKLCMGPRSPCLPIIFKLFPNGVGSDENIYSSFRIELPSAVHTIVPQGTSLSFHITTRDLHTADVLVSRHMEVPIESEAYMMEQFLAHEVIKSSQARHFEISIAIKVKASASGWVEIQGQH